MRSYRPPKAATDKSSNKENRNAVSATELYIDGKLRKVTSEHLKHVLKFDI